MKARIILLASILLLSLSWNSCKEEEIDKPAINITVLGYNNSGIGYLGGAFPVEADIIADGKIENIQIGFRPAGGQFKTVYASPLWTFDTVYTGLYTGLTTTTFGENIIIPLTADTGTYTFQFKVTDMEGAQTLVEEEVWFDYGK